MSDMWGPRGSHADSAATSDKIGVKTTKRQSKWFCKLGTIFYLDD